MNILTNPAACEEAICSLKNSIMDCYTYKSLLNRYYNPDSYLFFLDHQDLVPLVLKGGLATFYGGKQHNAANTLPDNPELINEVLYYLQAHGHPFQLLSLKMDYFDLLQPQHQLLDVPFPPEWHYLDVSLFNEKDFLARFSSKKRWSFKRVLKKKEHYSFETLDFNQLSTEYGNLIRSHISYFQERGKISVWSGNEQLLFQILEHFDQNEHLFTRVIKSGREIAAAYTIVHNPVEMIYFFGGSVQKDDNYIAKVMYFDLLQNAKTLADKSGARCLNGLRGAFGNKKTFGFTPTPLYALVHDKNWTVKRDSDIGEEEHVKVYGRNFGIESVS